MRDLLQSLSWEPPSQPNLCFFAKQYPEQMKIVGVVDPDGERRALTKERFHLQDEYCLADVEELISKPKIADAVINGTMDHLHVSSSIPLLRAGYDIMLEKPIGVSADEVMELYEEAERLGRKIMICHVLRYAPLRIDSSSRSRWCYR